MAASELCPTNTNSNLLVSSTVLSTLHQYKEKATDHLLLRDFKECKRICDSGIAFAKLHIEDDFAQETIESLCLLCIQAFAELNSWQDVLPYIQNVYSGIEGCPSAVIRLCILLHAKVKEYPKCFAIASIWLKSVDNISKYGYMDVAVLYVTHVLVPQGQYSVATQFLTSYTHLNTDMIETIVRDTNTLKGPNANSKGSSAEKIREEEEESCIANEEEESSVIKSIKKFGAMVVRKLPFVNLKTVVKVAVVATCVYLVAFQANKGDLMANIGRASLVWQGAMKILKTMFGPYRPGR